MRRRRHASRSTRYKRRLPAVLGWSVAVLVGAVGLVAVAYVHGNKPATDDGLVTSLHNTLAEPAVAAVAGFAMALLVAWGVRQLVFEFLAWWPGRIIVEEFATGPDVGAADATRLTADFRARLVRSHLQSPAPVPAPAQQGDFLDVLTAGAADVGTLFTGLLRVLRATKPYHAYEVRGALLTRDTPPTCGVTVHVVRLPGKAGPGQTFWDSSWDGAIRRAADHATASILPRTRRCLSPWSGWRGFHMPSKLFHSYERAAELEQDRRYDEALAFYYKALEQDPMNLGLRLQIGFLQEKLALFVDALATYESILEVARPGRNAVGADAGDARPAAVAADHPPDFVLGRRSRRDRLRRFHRSTARRDRDGVLLVAKYRRAILMGGQELPRQWAIATSGPQPNRRDSQRRQLRQRLRPALHELFEEAAGSDGPARLGAADLRKVLAEPKGDQLPEGIRLELEELLVHAALQDLSELRSQLPAVRLATGLTRDAVDLARLWMCERLRGLAAELAPGSAPAGIVSADELRRSVRRIEGRTRGFKSWQEHYNAACIYALPLLPRDHRPDEPEIRALSALAIERLEKAVACADSGYVASRRDWLLSDDPDLDGLRADPAFKRFEAMFFPAAARTPKRPRELHKWEVSRYTFALLSATAEVWEGTWRRRAGSLGADLDAQKLVEWAEVELAVWKRVRKVAVNHRHWQSRMALVEDMRRWGMEHGFGPLEVRFPRFSEEDAMSLDEEETGIADVRAIVAENDALLDTLAVAIECPEEVSRGCRLITDLDGWHSDLARLDLTGWRLRREYTARLCESHASLWRALLGYLENDGENLDKRLARAIRETKDLWMVTQRRWRGGALIGPRGKRSNGLKPRAGAGV